MTHFVLPSCWYMVLSLPLRGKKSAHRAVLHLFLGEIFSSARSLR